MKAAERRAVPERSGREVSRRGAEAQRFSRGEDEGFRYRGTGLGCGRLAAMGGMELLHDPGEVDGAARTFEEVLQCVGEARESIEIHMYVWRSDVIGNRVGEALLAAADRGVAVRIIKDVGAFLFERVEMNRKSFFNRALPWSKRVACRVAAPTFPDTHVEDDFGFECGRRLLAHPRVDVAWVNQTHTKYFVFDERILITGSINIEDRHRGYHDYMVRIEGKDDVERFRKRMAGDVSRDPGRDLEFLCNGRGEGFEIVGEVLRRLGKAEKSVFVEMAYLGDAEVSRALVAAARRGVRVVILFSKEANIGNDLNYLTAHWIFEKAPVEIYFAAKMIHSKMILFDEEAAVVGSCNLSVFSLRKAEELSLLVQGEGALLGSIRDVLLSRIEAGTRVGSAEELSGYNRWLAALQQWSQGPAAPFRVPGWDRSEGFGFHCQMNW